MLSHWNILRWNTNHILALTTLFLNILFATIICGRNVRKKAKKNEPVEVKKQPQTAKNSKDALSGAIKNKTNTAVNVVTITAELPPQHTRPLLETSNEPKLNQTQSEREEHETACEFEEESTLHQVSSLRLEKNSSIMLLAKMRQQMDKAPDSSIEHWKSINPASIK